ncbi:PH domain-containing protein [Curtobacterium flaccumfaciens]|nr:PH domain-containing protein [Curtobacterium flaccumfaciens]
MSKFNRGLAIALWLIVALLFVTTVLNDTTWADRALALVPTAFGVLLGWVALWRPQLTVDDDGIEVVNVFHTVRVPWAALVHVDTRFALTLVTPRRKIAVWAAPLRVEPVSPWPAGRTSVTGASCRTPGTAAAAPETCCPRRPATRRT